MCPTACCPPPPPVFPVSCPILHLALLSEDDESGTDISIRMLMCPKADKGASSVLLVGL